ncbi:MAG: S-methyl-5-thioribose-1-phosphate isomerase [Acidimicrobiia bacterium]|nr:S-methyl-5-thioribose-1-phosphate isomerase [Acidimicrobiia bacterium]
MTAPTIQWVDGSVHLIDQTLLPHTEEILEITSPAEMVNAIERLAIRGAPAIGVAGAYGVALAAVSVGIDTTEFEEAVDSLRNARPTAVNLARMVDRTAALRANGPERILEEAHAIREEELQASVAMGDLGADLILDLVGDRPIRAMTICNTGALATVERGTALSVIQTLHERDRLQEALPLETRPLLQGSRLTTWELQKMDAPFRLLVDSAGPFLLARGDVDVVLTGADRVAANGDTANKIGTFSIALGAAHAGVPFIVVAPESTVDANTATGSEIEIEDRGPSEVVGFGGTLTAPSGTPAINPAFDVTPVDLITALVTDGRVIRYDRGEGPQVPA